MKEVEYWSPKKVADWLLEHAMPEYCEPLEHFTGRDLIGLTREDFARPPLCRVSADSGQRLLDLIETLKVEQHMEAHKNGHANGHLGAGAAGPGPTGGFGLQTKPNGVPNGYRKEMIKIPMPEPERSQYPMEWGKTCLAFLYALSCFVLTTVMISVVHERVPPKEVQPPLPDTFFDHFNRVQWAFSICEINGMILVGLWLIQWLLLKYKSIISRRFFCIVGTLYLYRCITMYVTTLPVPGMHFNCSPKIQELLYAFSPLSWMESLASGGIFPFFPRIPAVVTCNGRARNTVPVPLPPPPTQTGSPFPGGTPCPVDLLW